MGTAAPPKAGGATAIGTARRIVTVVVVATTENEVAGVRACLSRLGVDEGRVLAPGGDRRLVLSRAEDEREGQRLTAILRAEGMVAVSRPDGGAHLDAWLRHTRPITFGERLGVCFAWSEHERGNQSNLIELGLGGFGSGEHPTTRLLVEELLARISGGERVLDVGCGSGVLGLCALGLGASHVVAVDVKADAVDATRRNAALNGMDGRVDATLTPLGEIDGAFDIVLANVGRAAVVELAPQLVRRVAPHGWLAVSGISPSQCSLVVGFLGPLVEVDRRTSGEWSSVVLGHRRGRM
jgi:ribosomal protein L11 methylase PrmA